MNFARLGCLTLLIALEGVLAAAPGKRYPRCMACERAVPPDDCGGPHGYAQLLDIPAQPDDPEHAESLEWATSIKGRRDPFDPEAFGEQQIKFANPAPRLKQLLAHLASRR